MYVRIDRGVKTKWMKGSMKKWTNIWMKLWINKEIYGSNDGKIDSVSNKDVKLEKR